MEHEQFTIRGATGVDLELPIAGPGSRSYAFIIDWHIRVLVALAWFVAAMLIVNGGLRWRPAAGGVGAASAFLVVLPAAAIYFLYHPVLELFMRGQTPGKRSAGVRIVTRDGGTPGVGAILIRNGFRLLDSLPACYLVGLIATFASAERVRIGDMAAGTLLVMDDGASPRLFEGMGAPAQRGAADPLMQDLAVQILERWPALDSAKRDDIARALLKKLRGRSADRIDAMSDDELKESRAALAGAACP